MVRTELADKLVPREGSLYVPKAGSSSWKVALSVPYCHHHTPQLRRWRPRARVSVFGGGGGGGWKPGAIVPWGARQCFQGDTRSSLPVSLPPQATPHPRELAPAARLFLRRSSHPPPAPCASVASAFTGEDSRPPSSRLSKDRLVFPSGGFIFLVLCLYGKLWIK